MVRRDGRTAAADALEAGDTVLVRASAALARTVRAPSPSALTKLKGRLARRRAAVPGTGSTPAASAAAGA